MFYISNDSQTKTRLHAEGKQNFFQIWQKNKANKQRTYFSFSQVIILLVSFKATIIYCHLLTIFYIMERAGSWMKMLNTVCNWLNLNSLMTGLVSYIHLSVDRSLWTFMWALAINLGTFVRATSAPNCWANTLVPWVFFIWLFDFFF